MWADLRSNAASVAADDEERDGGVEPAEVERADRRVAEGEEGGEDSEPCRQRRDGGLRQALVRQGEAGGVRAVGGSGGGNRWWPLRSRGPSQNRLLIDGFNQGKTSRTVVLRHADGSLFLGSSHRLSSGEPPLNLAFPVL